MTALVQLVEATEAAVRDRLERRLTSRVVRVFRKQRRAFPARGVASQALEMLASPLAEDVISDADPLAAIIREVWPDGEEDLAAALAREKAGAARASGNLTLARIGYDASFTVGDAVRDRIAGGSLVRATLIDDTSRARIRAVLARGIETGDGTDAIARAIRAEFDGWTRGEANYRAQRIARTEVAEAWESTQYEVMNRNGWQARVWLTAKDERVDAGGVSGPCIDNEAAGPVEIGRAFPSGDYWPPQHPNCRCTTAPAEGRGPQALGDPWTGGDTGGLPDTTMPEPRL